LWWNDSANVYVGDGKWIVGNEVKDYASIVWDEKLAVDTNHVLTVSTSHYDPDSIKDHRDRETARHIVLFNDLLSVDPTEWPLHGVFGAKLAGVQNVAVEGRSYKLFLTARTGGYGKNPEEWEVTDTSLTPQWIQEKLVNTLRFYASEHRVRGEAARITLEELGFSSSPDV